MRSLRGLVYDVRDPADGSVQDFADAAKGYLAIAILYDDPEHVPRALWNAGDSFEKNNELKQARQVYEELVERFKSHPLAERATQRLKQIPS